jgi:transposase
MLSLPPTMRIFLCTEPTDMRRSFDRLALMVEQLIGQDPLSGHLFVFCNRRGDRVKLLFFDRDGYVIWYKRLEEGTFRMSSFDSSGANDFEVQSSDLMMLLEGIDVASVKRHRRYVRRQS